MKITHRYTADELIFTVRFPRPMRMSDLEPTVRELCIQFREEAFRLIDFDEQPRVSANRLPERRAGYMP